MGAAEPECSIVAQHGEVNAAVTAVRQWRYQPVMRDGKAVEQRAAVRIRFTEE